MLDNEKFLTLLKKLLAKSRAGGVVWQEYIGEGGHDGFRVVFEDSTRIEIELDKPRSAPNFYSVWMVSNGRLIISMRIEEGDEMSREAYETLSALYDEAFRVVTGYDKAIETIESALSSEKPIGLAKDDMPF